MIAIAPPEGFGTAKGVVKREVVRVITPATQLEPDALDAGESSFVMAIEPGPTGLGVAYEDLTGDYTDLPFSAARMSPSSSTALARM